MKANKNIKRLSLLAILLLSTFTISANPLTYILGTEATGLDIVYILMGISGISLLLIYPDYSLSTENKHETINLRVSDDSKNYQRKVIKKTC